MKNGGMDLRIRKLAELRNAPFPILTIYLGYAGKQSPSAKLMISQLHSLVSHQLSDKEKKLFKGDLQKIEDYLKEVYDKRGKRSLAIFSAGNNLWQVFDFEFYLSPFILVAYSPYIKPIVDAINKYKRYLVLLVDREKMRLFTVYLGKIEAVKDVYEGSVPQKVKAKKVDFGRDDKIFRHIEDHLHRHLKFIADAADDFIQSHDISFILIGGHKEMLPKIKKHLQYPLNKMVLGEFVTELNIPLNSVLLHSKRIVQEMETR